MKSETKELECPRCHEPYEVDIYQARDGQWKATGDPCDSCGYLPSPSDTAGDSAEIVSALVEGERTMEGFRARWTSKGVTYGGVIEKTLLPGFDCRELGQHGIFLHAGTNKSSKMRYLLLDDNDRYHAVRSRSVYVYPFKVEPE